jgi:hypothetical protein
LMQELVIFLAHFAHLSLPPSIRVFRYGLYNSGHNVPRRSAFSGGNWGRLGGWNGIYWLGGTTYFLTRMG